jgi:hypothetical protein
MYGFACVLALRIYMCLSPTPQAITKSLPLRLTHSLSFKAHYVFSFKALVAYQAEQVGTFVMLSVGDGLFGCSARCRGRNGCRTLARSH